MRPLLQAGRGFLTVATGVFLASCSGDRITSSEAGREPGVLAIHVQSTESRRLDDLATLRRLGSDPAARARTAVGATWRADVPIEDLIAKLESLPIDGGTVHPMYFERWVDGGSTINVDGGPPYSRNVIYWAVSYCIGDCSSALLTTGGDMRIVQKTLGGTTTLDTEYRFSSFGGYASGQYMSTVNGDAQFASVSTKHWTHISFINPSTKYSFASRNV